MAAEITITEVHRGVIVWKGACIGCYFYTLADGSVLWLRRGNVHRCAYADEAEKLRRDIFVQPDAAVAGWIVLDPASVEAVVGLKFTPIRHRRAFERPARGATVAVGFTSIFSVVSPAVAIGALVLIFKDNLKISLWCGGASSANSAGRDEKRLRALHDVDQLLAQRNFHADRRWIPRQRSWQIIGVIGTESRT